MKKKHRPHENTLHRSRENLEDKGTIIDAREREMGSAREKGQTRVGGGQRAVTLYVLGRYARGEKGGDRTSWEASRKEQYLYGGEPWEGGCEREQSDAQSRVQGGSPGRDQHTWEMLYRG